MFIARHLCHKDGYVCTQLVYISVLCIEHPDSSILPQLCSIRVNASVVLCVLWGKIDGS